MERKPIFLNGFWSFLFWIVVLSLALLFIVLLFKWHEIEEDVAKNATQSLENAGLNWASVKTFNDGRTATISGVAPSEDEAKLALKLVEDSEGVHIAKYQYDKIEIIPASPAYLNAIVTGNSIVLRGTLKDQSAIDALLSKANAIYGEENVVNKLEVGDNIAPLPSHDGLLKSLVGKGGSAPFSASFVDGGLTLNGQVINSDQKRAIGNQISGLVDIDIINNINVVLPVIKHDVCLELVNELLSKGKINFETAQGQIKESSHELLKNIAEIAERCPKSNFEIAGHTDSTGRLAFNMKLSQARAQAVVDHLIGLGLSAQRFTPTGYGPNKPIADNGSKEGREQNRRIEFVLKNDNQEQNSN